VTAATTIRRVTLWVTLAYVLVLALIAFWPTPVDRDIHGSLLGVIGWLHNHGAPRWVDYDFIQFSANVALFVPVGLLVGMFAGRRRWWLGIVVGFLTSCGIELGQLMFLPERYATVNDVIANTLGAVIGALLAGVTLQVIHARHGVPHRAGAEPSGERRR
jgi:glycopeptide antibiotics resistance protein